jgi:hypothetical protein
MRSLIGGEMQNTKELITEIRLMGCKANFKPYWDSESKTILLEARHPAEIVDGRLVGSQIDVYDESTFRIWTPRKTKAKACALRYNLIIRLLDEECELFIPATLADELLPRFGTKVKRAFSAVNNVRLKAIGYKKHTLE